MKFLSGNKHYGAKNFRKAMAAEWTQQSF